MQEITFMSTLQGRTRGRAEQGLQEQLDRFMSQAPPPGKTQLHLAGVSRWEHDGALWAKVRYTWE